jgi:hypothetical protein
MDNWLGKIALAAVLSLLLATSNAEETVAIQPFSTDGCSAFPDGTTADRQRWQACCIAHDLAYWAGGSYDDRLAVDEAMAECVADVGEPAIAKLMLAGVRAGGSPYFPTTYRWGYGWPYVRGYKALNDAEKAAVMRAIDAATPEAFVPHSPPIYLQWVPPSADKP